MQAYQQWLALQSDQIKGVCIVPFLLDTIQRSFWKSIVVYSKARIVRQDSLSFGLDYVSYVADELHLRRRPTYPCVTQLVFIFDFENKLKERAIASKLLLQN